MRSFIAKNAAAILATSLMMAPTASAAAELAAPAPLAQQAAQDPWVALSMMNAAAAGGFAGTAQPDRNDNAPPPPAAYGTIQTPPIPVIAIWLGTLAMAVYILSIHERGHGQFPVPPHNSPA